MASENNKWAKYAMIESPVAGYDPVRVLIDTDVMSKVLTDPKADVKALLDAAVKKSNDVLKENAQVRSVIRHSRSAIGSEREGAGKPAPSLYRRK